MTSNKQEAQHNVQMMRMAHIVQCTRLSRSLIYKMIANGTFPKGQKLGERAVGWREDVVNDWIASRADNSANV